MQVDMSHLYTRFGEKEKEALASFDFLRAFEEDKIHTYPDHHVSRKILFILAVPVKMGYFI